MQFILITLSLFLLPMLFIYMNILFSKKSLFDREKYSPFECGFDPISNNRTPFNINFFMISLIFLIFDIEIIIIIPIIYMLMNFYPYMIIMTLMFLLFLTIGLYLEYSEFSMDWKI